MPDCGRCGEQHDDGARFCGACGASLARPLEPPEEVRSAEGPRVGRPLIAIAALGVAFVTAVLAALFAFVLVTGLGAKVAPSAPAPTPLSADGSSATTPAAEPAAEPAAATSSAGDVATSWILQYAVPEKGIESVTEQGEATLVRSLPDLGRGGDWSPDRRFLVEILERGWGAGAQGLRIIDTESGESTDIGGAYPPDYVGWKPDSSGFLVRDLETGGLQEVDAVTHELRAVADSTEYVERGGAKLAPDVEARILGAVKSTLPAEMTLGEADSYVVEVVRSPDGDELAVGVEVVYNQTPGGVFVDMASQVNYYGMYLADADGGNVREIGEGFAPTFIETVIPVAVPTAVVPPRTFTDAVPLPTQVSRDPKVIGTNFTLAVIFALLFGFTSTVFNNALKENMAEVDGLFLPLARFRDVLTARLSSRPAYVGRIEMAAVLVLSGLIYGFLDPQFGLSWHGLRVFLSFSIAVGVVTYAYDGTQALVAHKAMGVPARVVLYPSALLIALVCVVISRVTGFHPGYVWGFVGGMAFLGSAEPDDRGKSRLVLVSSFALMAVSLVAWFLSVPVDAAITAGAGWLRIVADLCAGVFVAGLEGLAFGLVPLAFMDGEKVFRAGKAMWLVLYVGVLFLFWHVLLNPGAAYLDAMGETSTQVAVVLLVFYVFLTTGAYWYFKLVRQLLPAEATAG